MKNKKFIVAFVAVVIVAIIISIVVSSTKNKTVTTTEDINAQQPAGVTITSEVEDGFE